MIPISLHFPPMTARPAVIKAADHQAGQRPRCGMSSREQTAADRGRAPHRGNAMDTRGRNTVNSTPINTISATLNNPSRNAVNAVNGTDQNNRRGGKPANHVLLNDDNRVSPEMLATWQISDGQQSHRQKRSKPRYALMAHHKKLSSSRCVADGFSETLFSAPVYTIGASQS